MMKVCLVISCAVAVAAQDSCTPSFEIKNLRPDLDGKFEQLGEYYRMKDVNRVDFGKAGFGAIMQALGPMAAYRAANKWSIMMQANCLFGQSMFPCKLFAVCTHGCPEGEWVPDQKYETVWKIYDEERQRHSGEVEVSYSNCASPAPVVVAAASAKVDAGGSCANPGHCGLAYEACCAGMIAAGYPCGCHLKDGNGTTAADCGTCGTAYSTCCFAYGKKGFPCTCDISDGGVGGAGGPSLVI
jgi:hypothetical protein